jgi:DNA replication protein DnaC
MTAFLRIDDCKACHRSLPWEWVPAVLLNGKGLPGTGVWRSQLVRGICSACALATEARSRKERQALALRASLVALLGGEHPYREFTFERYEMTPGNQLAFETAKHFSPATQNLYLWGPCGLGKTHLAWACARRSCEEALSVDILRAGQISRKFRLKEPEAEQAAIDQAANAQMLVLDDLGSGPDTAFTRHVLQEILDERIFRDRAGLIVTSKYTLEGLMAKMNDDSIPSRLAGMCTVLELRGTDHRIKRKPSL